MADEIERIELKNLNENISFRIAEKLLDNLDELSGEERGVIIVMLKLSATRMKYVELKDEG